MKQRPLDEIAEPATFGIGPPKVAVDQLKRELLEDFIGRVRVAQHLAQITPDRVAVALEQLLAGGARFLSRTLIGPADQRPERRDQVEPVVVIVRLYRLSFCLCVPGMKTQDYYAGKKGNSRHIPCAVRHGTRNVPATVGVIRAGLILPCGSAPCKANFVASCHTRGFCKKSRSEHSFE
jgi:hypothetical protein